ncbi:hypothetical protein CW304_11480 [Bacillus sp. UFRGS-B20]|nr:hypothetical protein CW304_11480 [Bacillus sp. UFRGS-B20]
MFIVRKTNGVPWGLPWLCTFFIKCHTVGNLLLIIFHFLAWFFILLATVPPFLTYIKQRRKKEFFTHHCLFYYCVPILGRFLLFI